MKKISFFGLLFCFCLPLISFAQNVTHTFQHGGQSREAIVHIPQGYTQGTEVPLVLMLHGLGDNMTNFMQGTGFNGQSEASTFIVAYPNALDEFGLGKAWNNTTIPFATADDLGYLAKLLDTLEANYSINPDRIYVAGFSMGGIMSHYVSCNLASRVAAMASVGGPIPSGITSGCNPNRPVPVMHIHGDADATVPYAGGLPGVDSVMGSLRHWINHNNCPQAAQVTVVPNTRQDGISVEKYLWGYGNDSSEVLHFKLIGGDHIWPSLANDISANTEIWRFFDRHHLNAGPTAIPEGLTYASIQLYPNPLQHQELTIEFGEIVPQNIRVIDALGQEVWQSKVNANLPEMKIPTSQWRSGVYLLEMRIGEQVACKRFVIQ